MSAERSWPHRFRVTIRTRTGESLTYPVVTWRSQAEAIALAVSAHQRKHAEEPDNGISDVEIEDLGPVRRAADGTTALDPSDIHDRYEF